MTVRYKHRYNIAGYRTALNRMKLKVAGIYPLIDWQGNVMFYVMHKNLEKLRYMCMEYLNCPCHFIRFKKMSRYSKKSRTYPAQFYYVILMGFHAAEWEKRMKYGNRMWRKI
jgi:hypothetical protein